jgi:hypothetical protein
MKVSNEKFLKGIRILQIVLFLVMAISIIYLLVSDINEQTWNYIILIVSVYLLINVFFYIKRYLFLSFEEDNAFLIVKFFNSFILNSGKHKIRIPKKNFYKYELKNSSLHNDLILYVNTPNGIAKYPPLSLSAFNRKKLQVLINYLDKLSNKPANE